MAKADPDIGLQLGDFKLLRKLGEGAAGVVYHARQLSFERDAAVKVLFKTSAKHVERFYREARLAGRLDHPHIVQGYAVGEDRGLHYFAMEYVDGQSLQDWLEQLGRLRLGDALHITVAVARALGYAHDQALVHRDVKPGNVLIGRAGAVKVADLGMAKIRDDDLAALTRTGRGMGTPCFMPMEQFVNAKDADARCDIYALGCTLYALLTGQPPFTSPSFLELIQAKELGTFPLAGKVNPEVPEPVDAIIARMAAKRPDDRYRTCAEVIEVLERLGLAETRLRLERPAKVSSPVPTEKSPSSTAPVRAPASGGSARVSSVAQAASSPVAETPAIEHWEVTFKPADQKPVVRQLTTAQLIEWIRSKDFAPDATARRGPETKDKPLAAYRELRQAVLDRVAPKAAGPTAVRGSRAVKTQPEIRAPRATVHALPATATAKAGERPDRAPVPTSGKTVSWPRVAWWAAAASAVILLAFWLAQFVF